MRAVIKSMATRPWVVFGVIALLIPFAYLLNLGLMPLISDEPTRAVVTLEMLLSGNYINPTINGEFYYNKPPLFNWLLAGLIWLTGSESELVFRTPTIVSLLLLSLAIYCFSRKHLGNPHALLAALMMISSARILFWDSFQGLIDITYSLVTFLSFAAIWKFSNRGRWFLMFTISYLLAAAGFLMKGIPSLAFQGISLVVWLLWDRKFRKLFTWQHLAGIMAFALALGIYYTAYLKTNTLDEVFLTLFDQSNRLSDKEGTFLSWVKHLAAFPFEMVYEFAPWTLLVVFLFIKDVRKNILQERFMVFNLVIFSSNIIIYWVSADMRPRYLFMLFPLVFIVLARAAQLTYELKHKLRTLVVYVLQVMAFLAALSPSYYLIWDETAGLPGVWIVIPLLIMAAAYGYFVWLRGGSLRWAGIVIILLAVRISFNACNLPARYNSYPDASYREGEIKAGRLAGDCKILVLGDTPFNHDASFYIARESRQIITRTTEVLNSNACYIADDKNLANFADRLDGYEIIHTFTIKLNETRLFLLKKSV